MQQKTPASWRKWTILLAVGLIHFVGNFAQYQMSPIASRIIEQMGLTATEYSSAFSAPMAPAIFFSLIVGIVVDKLGVKRPIALSLVLSLIGMVMRVFAFNYVMLYASLFLIGASTMMANVNGSKILSQWFPKEKVGIMLGVAMAMASAGQAAGLATGAMFRTNQIAYIFATALGGVCLAWWLAFARDAHPQQAGEGAAKIEAPPTSQCLKVVLKNHYVWIIGVCMLANIAASVVLASMLPTALAERGVDSVSAGVVSSIFTIGGLVGCIVIPNLVARNGGKRRLILVAFCAVYALGMWQGWRAPMGAPMFIIMFVTGFCMGGMGPVLTSIPLQLPEVGPLYAGTAGGIISTLQLMGPVIVVPYLITPIANGNYNLYFTLAALCVVLLLVLCIFLPSSVAKTLRRKK